MREKIQKHFHFYWLTQNRSGVKTPDDLMPFTSDHEQHLEANPAQNLDQQTIFRKISQVPRIYYQRSQLMPFSISESFLQAQCHVGTFWRVCGLPKNVFVHSCIPHNIFSMQWNDVFVPENLSARKKKNTRRTKNKNKQETSNQSEPLPHPESKTIETHHPNHSLATRAAGTTTRITKTVTANNNFNNYRTG